MNIAELKNFLMEANKAGYASGDEKMRVKEIDGSTTITYESGKWKMVDNYAGGEPYSGMSKIFYKNKIVFGMVYYGAVEKEVEDFKQVYGFLSKSLLEMPADYPYRGPKELKEGDWHYINKWKGEVQKFEGEEQIFLEGKKVFWTKYIGGLVNVREE